MTPRPYQSRALDELWGWFGKHNGGNPIVEACVGAGKSLMIALLAQRADVEYPGTRVLVLVHQKELLEQNLEKLLAVWPSANVGLYSAGAGRKDLGCQLTYATIGSIWRDAHLLGRIDIVLADECFTGETLISTPSGAKRIDAVRCGDLVYNQAGIGIVNAVSVRSSTDIYELEFEDGTVTTCTGNHPFFTSQGWKPASQLEDGEGLYSIEAMQALWSGVQALDQAGRVGENDLGMPGADMGEARLLLNIVLKEVCESDEQQSSPNQDARKAARDQASSYQARRQRAIAAFAAACSAARLGRGMGVGASSSNKDAEGERIPDSLQNRHSEYHIDDCNRAGRGISRVAGKEITGQQEGRIAGLVRVVRVSRLERESPTPVFNLQVSGHPSYFANGVAVHNCHLINPKEAGMWRSFLSDLARYNPNTRCIGWTGTPFRGNGVWLTAGDEALFNNVATRVTMRELLDLGFLSPLVPATTVTRIDAHDVRTSGDDYVISELAKVTDTDELVEATCNEIVDLAKDRKRWLVFAVTVQHAEHVRDALRHRGVSAEVVSAKTPKQERAQLIADYRAGRIKCLVNVAVLTTGFDVPEVDFIALLRATKSPVLYVQIAGRGMRIANDKSDCMWADFTDTTALMGPVDEVKGRLPTGGRKGVAPHKLCPECGSQNATGVTECMDCGFVFPEPERIKHGTEASSAAILSSQKETMFSTVPIDEVRYRLHEKPGSQSSLRVEYYAGMLRVASEWVCLSHEGYARKKAETWWNTRTKIDAIPGSVDQALEWLDYDPTILRQPAAIIINKSAKYPAIVSYQWEERQAA